jgi:hypothetical protein
MRWINVFYSQQGVFRGSIKDDLSRIENWEKIIKLKLHCTKGQSNAAGSPMNVTKIQVIDRNKFFFVSKNDGIGLFDRGNVYHASISILFVLSQLVLVVKRLYCLPD